MGILRSIVNTFVLMALELHLLVDYNVAMLIHRPPKSEVSALDRYAHYIEIPLDVKDADIGLDSFGHLPNKSQCLPAQRFISNVKVKGCQHFFNHAQA
jgi:hypothetical protein